MDAAGVKPTETRAVVPGGGVSVTGQDGSALTGKTDSGELTSATASDALPTLDRVTSMSVALSPTRVGGKAIGLGEAWMAGGPAAHVPVWQVSLAVHGSPLSQVVPFGTSTSVGHEALAPVQTSSASH